MRSKALCLRAAPPRLSRGGSPHENEEGAQTKHFLYGAPKNHDRYGLSVFCMDKRYWNNFIVVFTRCGVCDPP